MPAAASLISLASGYGHFATPAPVAARVAELLRQRGPLPTSPTEGLPELRAALAARYHSRGAPAVTPADVIVTPGAKAALWAVLTAVLRPGDEVLLPTPNWFGFEELVVRAGGVLRPLPLCPADGYALRPEAVAAALTPRTRLLLFTNPCNPTGRIYTRTEMAALLHVTNRHPGLWVLADEIYDGICFGPEPVPTLLSFADPHGQHVVVSGFSKSLALAGWGVGYLVAPPGVVRAATAAQFATSGAAAVPSQLAALAATEAAAEISAGLCQQLRPNRQRLLDFLQNLPTALPRVPAGTYYAFPDLRPFLHPALPPAAASTQLTERLHAAGVAVVDGATCGSPGFVRLSYAVPEADLLEALRRLQQELR